MHCSCVNDTVTKFTISLLFYQPTVSVTLTGSCVRITVLDLVHCSLLTVAVHSVFFPNAIF